MDEGFYVTSRLPQRIEFYFLLFPKTNMASAHVKENGARNKRVAFVKQLTVMF